MKWNIWGLLLVNETDRIRDVLVKLNRSLLRKFPAKGFYYSYSHFGDYHHGSIFLELPPEVNLDDDSIQDHYYSLLYPYFKDFLCHITIFGSDEIDTYPASVERL